VNPKKFGFFGVVPRNHGEMVRFSDFFISLFCKKDSTYFYDSQLMFEPKKT